MLQLKKSLYKIIFWVCTHMTLLSAQVSDGKEFYEKTISEHSNISTSRQRLHNPNNLEQLHQLQRYCLI